MFPLQNLARKELSEVTATHVMIGQYVIYWCVAFKLIAET